MYFIEILNNKKIEIVEISKEKYNSIERNKEKYKDTKKYFWTVENKDYEIINYYTTKKNEIKEVKENIEVKEKEYIEKVNIESNSINIPYFAIIVILAIVYFFYSQLKKLGQVNNKEDVEKVKKVKLKDNKKSKEVQRSPDFNLKTYEKLDELRKSLRKDFMSYKVSKNREFEKKEIYEDFKKLLENIKNKKDLQDLNNDYLNLVNKIEEFKNE